MIDVAAVRANLRRENDSGIESFRFLSSVESTNLVLLGDVPPAPGKYKVLAAGEQTVGRGRMGRSWQSPLGAGLYLSASLLLPKPLENPGTLSLAVGAEVATSLCALGIREIAIKWPNDIYARDKKLGGILTELKSAANKQLMVIGIGLNIDFAQIPPVQRMEMIADNATDISANTSQLPDSEVLYACVIDALLDATRRFLAHGFAAFADDWRARDWLQGRNVSVESEQLTVSGRCTGIDAGGALLVETESGPVRFHSGSVRLYEPNRRS